MSTYGSGMWDSFKDESDIGDLISSAVKSTEREIFDSAMDSEPPDDSFDDSMESMEDIDGEVHDNDTWFGLNSDGTDPDDGESEPEYQQPQQYQHEQPRQEVDMFADPDGWRRQVIQDRAEFQTGRTVPELLLNNIPYRDPDEMFSNPDQYKANMLYDASIMTEGVKAYNEAEQALQDELREAGENIGEDKWRNIKDDIARTVPGHARRQFEQNLVIARMNGVDVVNMLETNYNTRAALTEHASKNGYKLAPGQGISRPKTNWAAKANGLSYERPKPGSERAELEDIFNSAFD